MILACAVPGLSAVTSVNILDLIFITGSTFVAFEGDSVVREIQCPLLQRLSGWVHME